MNTNKTYKVYFDTKHGWCFETSEVNAIIGLITSFYVMGRVEFKDMEVASLERFGYVKVS